MTPPSWLLRALPYGLAVIAVAGACWFVYSKGAEHKANELELEYQAERDAHELEIRQLQERIATNEQAHRRTSQLISDQLADIREDSARTISALQSGFALRMRESEDRASIYERMSDAGAVERANLASHAAQLDRALEQGRLLVGELRSTLAERDGQIRLLGEQLTADRELISNTGNTTTGE